MKALLIDLSGTLHIGDQPIAGAVDAVHKLRAAKLPIRFASNTTKESRTDLLARLRRIGFRIDDHELITSLSTAASLCRSRALKPLLLLSDSAIKEFANQQYSVDELDSVVVGLAPSRLDYEHLNKAFRLLSSKKEIPLIATHKAFYFRDSDGELSVGPGAFIAGLEEATGIKAEIVGKPSRTFFEQCLSSIDNLTSDDWKDVGVVGDDVRQDLGDGAVDLGLRRFLVKTGKYRAGDEDKAREPLAGVEDSFASFVERLLATQP